MPQVAHRPPRHHFNPIAPHESTSFTFAEGRSGDSSAGETKRGHGGTPAGATRKIRGTGEEQEMKSSGEELAALDDRLSRLEQALQKRFFAAGLSLFSSPASLDGPNILLCRQIDDVYQVSEGVRRLSFSPTLPYLPSDGSSLSSTSSASPSPGFTPCPSPPPTQSVFGAIYIPESDSALESVAALHEHSTFLAPPNPSTDGPWSQSLIPSTSAHQDDMDVKMAQLLCGMRRKGQFASMSLFPELSSPSCATSPPFGTSSDASLSTTPSTGHSTHRSPTHTPCLSPASPASSDDEAWYSDVSSPLPEVLRQDGEKEEIVCPASPRGGRSISLPALDPLPPSSLADSPSSVQ
ncbi:hypothetical protein JCM11251_007258 [Rhodosporidiobolus azoricus]